MQPVEINAGQWYLRALRADSRIDDRPALAELGVTDPDHVARCAALWSADTSYSWAVCEVTTGELLAEVTLDPDTGEIATRARGGQAEAAAAAAESVRRFAADLGFLETPSGVVGPVRPE
ncbi:MAG: hypothetical protein WAN71_04490 [Mycobacterium sp.]|uniref:hypothetical protein n=1 Tax=Mycobacterium sp. TaxID=1785 RepID=UPI003BAF5B83